MRCLAIVTLHELNGRVPVDRTLSGGGPSKQSARFSREPFGRRRRLCAGMSPDLLEGMPSGLVKRRSGDKDLYANSAGGFGAVL